MQYLIPLIVCSFVAIVSGVVFFNAGRNYQKVQDVEAIRLMRRDVDVYNDYENAEATVFITLEDKPEFDVVAVVVNDGENIRLYKEARGI